MFENIINFFKRAGKKEEKKETANSKEAAKERLHLVLMQDRANVSADFLELMKQEIIEVIKKYIEVDEGAIDVRLTNKENEDGTNGAPALYANIPILNIKNEARKVDKKDIKEQTNKKEEEETKENNKKITENYNQSEKNKNEGSKITEKTKIQQNSRKDTGKKEEKIKENNEVQEKEEIKENKVEEKTKDIKEQKEEHQEKTEKVIEKISQK